MKQIHMFVTPCAVVLLAGVCNAQRCGWRLEAPPAVSPHNPVIWFRVYAWWDRIPGVAEMFHTGDFQLRASDPAFEWFEPGPGINSNDPHGTPILPTAIDGLRVHNLHWPPTLPGIQGNPIHVLYVRWRVQEFRPRVVTFTVEPLAGQSMMCYHSPQGSASSPYPTLPVGDQVQVLVEGPSCYADCDTSTGVNVLDIFDFLCFQNRYAANDPRACDCDTTWGLGVCDIFDFLCFQNAFAAGCP